MVTLGTGTGLPGVTGRLLPLRTLLGWQAGGACRRGPFPLCRVGEGRACWSLGNTYVSMGSPAQALTFAKKHLQISQEVSSRPEHLCPLPPCPSTLPRCSREAGLFPPLEYYVPCILLFLLPLPRWNWAVGAEGLSREPPTVRKAQPEQAGLPETLSPSGSAQGLLRTPRDRPLDSTLRGQAVQQVRGSAPGATAALVGPELSIHLLLAHGRSGTATGS